MNIKRVWALVFVAVSCGIVTDTLHHASLLRFNAWATWIVLVTIFGSIAFKIFPDSEEADAAENGALETDPDLLLSIKVARCVHELVDILDEYDSSGFSDEENQAFRERTESLHLTKNDWALILESVQGEESYLEGLAGERTAQL
jgi:hypothetical protein